MIDRGAAWHARACCSGSLGEISFQSVKDGQMETARSIRDFWFGSNPDDAGVAQEKASLWWRKNPEVDAQIRDRFATTLAMAARRELDGWLDNPEGRLALILLTDQMSRNMYRGTPQAFAYDGIAREWCVDGLALGADAALRPIERVFFYLPLEHSELLEDQERAVVLFQSLRDAADARLQPVFDGFLDYAVRHREVIARFGRFPHRNKIVGRPSTPAEEAFLQEPGSSF